MRHRLSLAILAVAAASLVSPGAAAGQDRLKSYPGYERYARMSKEIPGAVKSAAVQVTWTSPSTFEYVRDGKLHRYDVASRTGTIAGDAPPAAAAGRRGPERGRQFDSADSPDGTLKAFYRDRNLWVSDAAGASFVFAMSMSSE